MEVVGAASSIIAVIQVADRVISLCKFYLGLVRDAPSDIRVILIETSSLKTILDNIQFLVSNGYGPTTLNTLTGKDGPIEGCRKALDQLSGLLSSEPVHETSGDGSKKRKVKTALTALAWPFKENTARKLLAEIVQHKTTLNLSLTADISCDIKNIKGKASEIQTTLTEFERREVYRWLQSIDPSELHHRACSQYEAGTGDWVLRSEDWKAWISGPKRALWVHGIPGAGKTVLASRLIEAIKAHCQESSRTESKKAYAYYYCYFGHNADEASPFLRWTICQLARAADAVPDKLYKLYKRGEGPSLGDLLQVLEALVESFDSIYFTLDAIDESIPRVNLLKVLRDLITDPRFAKIRILVTSRECIDIEESMTGISVPISMRNPLLDEDIRLFVQAQLRTHPKLSRWPASVQDEALEALSTKAKGMFRWVVCQIDSLQRLQGNRDTITKALASLPRTLDETYERIFLQIPDEARPFVHHALKWIYAHNELHEDNICPSNLIQAVQRSTAGLDPSGSDHDYNEDLLREFCGCLILVSPQIRFSSWHDFEPRPAVSFAHYTVLEFLDSTRIRTGLASCFAIDKALVKLEFAKMVILEVLDTKPKEFGSTEDEETLQRVVDAVEEDFNVYSIVSSILAARNWAGTLSKDSTLCKLVFRMLDATNTHFKDFTYAARWIEDNTDWFSDLGITKSKQFWDLNWRKKPRDNDIRTLTNILFTDESGELGRNFVQRLRANDVLRGSIQLEIVDPNREADLIPYKFNFKGTILELTALLANKDGGDNLRSLLDLAVGSFDPLRILLLSIHWHYRDRRCAEDCYLARLLQLEQTRTAMDIEFLHYKLRLHNRT